MTIERDATRSIADLCLTGAIRAHASISVVQKPLGLECVERGSLGGCVMAPDQRHYADGVVMVAPPAPRLEVIGEPPSPVTYGLAGTGTGSATATSGCRAIGRPLMRGITGWRING